MSLPCLVPQGQKRHIMTTLPRAPHERNVLFLQQKKTDSTQQGLAFLFSPLLEEYYNPAHGHAEDNNNDQAPNASFQEDEFINPFCTRVQETEEGNWISKNHCNQLLDRTDRIFRCLRITQVLFTLSMERVIPALSCRFVDPDHPEKVYILRKALYGLKQAPRAWYDELSNFLMSKGFTKGLQIHQSPKDLSGEHVDQSDYRSKIGSLMYLTSSRPDLVQAYPKDSGFELTAFSNADHAGCLDTRKSTSGGIQFLGDKLVSWMSKKQNCTAMSSAEAEYVALSASCAQVMWMRTQLQDYGFNYNKIPLYCDSQSAIAISCNPVQHSRTKHIHTRYHFIKEQVENGIIELYFVRTEYQLADMFTKALPEDRFKYLVRRIGMRCLTPAELEVLTNETA
ncbi:ribonuclease H-like domain-containing protein [Tanacetum coccineum]